MRVSKVFVVGGLLAVFVALCGAGFLWVRSVGLASQVRAQAVPSPSTLSFPQSELRITLPSNPRGNKEPSIFFDPSKEGAPLLNSMVDFPAQFWEEVPGSVIFNVGGKIRRDDYPREILSTEDLEEYVRWWIMSGDNAEGCSIRRAELNGIPAVVRSWNNYPESNEIYSILMGPDVFVDVASRITFYTSGRKESGKWIPQGEEIRRKVLESIEVVDGGGSSQDWAR